ncbi:meiotic recombination protein REC114 isoform X2 [Cheilinus undulatus]|uniref:meiotic recombination protein REC114 isoform X2 n=1 Tax=Cheilinus undulatus TaxID=241271 RepID=UPI001BD325DB|nr:meiotic recombination protein REC114 isoform X2 [Cheilinus undulatus]
MLDMAACQEWRLKRYGRFVPGSEETGGKAWKVFETNDDKPGVVLTILESGYLMVLQGKQSLDTIPLLCASDSLKVYQKSDNLMFQFTVKGERRMMRMQFNGSSKAEAIKKCSSAAEKLMEYIPVTTQKDTPLALNQTPAGVTAPVKQTSQRKSVGAEPGVVKGSLSIEHLTQHFLGDTAVTLPQVYHHSSLAQVDLGPILRLCLLDPSFPAFVDDVEGELRKLLEE